MNRRYNDADLMSDPSLYKLATEYLKKYTGSFEPLTAAQAAYSRQGLMSIQTARMVLNCMLTDANVVNMPVPKHVPFDASAFATIREDDFAVGHAELESMYFHERVRLATKPRFLKINWNGNVFGISNHVQAVAVHRLDTLHSNAKYYPAEHRIQWNISWVCTGGSGPPHPYTETIALMSLDDAILLTQSKNADHVPNLTKGDMVRPWRMCKTCQRMRG